VASNGTADAGCWKGDPCPSIGDALSVAEAPTASDPRLAGAAVTVAVASGTYPGAIDVSASELASVTIQGAGASTTEVAGGDSTRDFAVSGGTVTISNLSIDDGHAATSGGGGVSVTGSDTITLSHDDFSGDSAAYGGALSDGAGSATVSDDTFVDDSATDSGGGVADTGANATFTDDTFAGDFTTSKGTGGGGISNLGAKSTLTNDTFFDDGAGYGGGLFNANATGTVTMTDDTFSEDSATTGGGGIFNFLDATATVTASLFETSTCGNLTATLTGNDDVTTSVTCEFGPTSIRAATLDLATALEPNTSSDPETLALFPASPAIDAVPSAACSVKTDERGDPRPGIPDQTSCDAGAYELQHTPGTLTQAPPEGGFFKQGTPASFQLAVTNPAATTGTVAFTVTGTLPAGVTVAPTGKISVSASTKSGGYRLVGTDGDRLGDTGTWSFTLSSTDKVYVSHSGTKTSGCTGPGKTACQTTQEGVAVAEEFPGDALTVTVAAGTYNGGVTVTASKLASLTVRGSGQASTKVTGDGTTRDFLVTGGKVTLSALSIDGAHVTTSPPGGGGVANTGGTVILTEDTFANDFGADGGGLSNNSGSATVFDDTFSDDSGGDGGGVFALGPTTLTDDTFVHDAATGGGGVFNQGLASMRDDTFLDDIGATGGGGFYNVTGGTLTVVGSIFDASTCANTAATVSGNDDVTTSATCKLGSKSIVATALDLASTLAPNTSGGPETLALGPTSPAIDRVPANACRLKTDERGDPRPGISDQTSCDAGAYELQHTPGTLTQGTPSSGSVAHGKKRAFQLSVTNTAAVTGKIHFTATPVSLPSGVTVSSTGKISVGASTTVGSYRLTGSDSDPVHDTGSWTFELHVKATG
jgi:fibronectin-binding autotransporter adhesin